MNPYLKRSRGSLGVKLIIVCILVVLMAIPAMFVSYISFERSNRADEVTREVSQRYGGPQYLTGPLLAVPYIIEGSRGEIRETGEIIISPEQGSVNFDQVDVKVRRRSLFKVPVYQTIAGFKAEFGPWDMEEIENGRVLRWEKARFLIGLSDRRGLSEDIYLSAPGRQQIKFAPAKMLSVRTDFPEGTIFYHKVEHRRGLVGNSDLVFLSAPAAAFLDGTDPFSVTTDIHFGGARELGVYPFAKTTRVQMNSNWASPGFKGAFAPRKREIEKDGFSAQWSVPFLARGELGVSDARHFTLLHSPANAMTTQFVAEVSPYQTVNRALKYSVLFIGLVFMTFFLFEVMVGRRVHPAQYLLIGLAQTIFYLLLLAFSEHVGFVFAYLLSAGATVSLSGAYAGAVLGNRDYAIRAGGVFAVTYGLLFSLMRLQDFALLIGALASFAAIALIMYLTRDLNWYESGKDAPQTSFKTSPAK